MRIDRHLRRAEDRSVDAGGEGHAQRVVRRDGHDARFGAYEFVQVVGVAADDVIRPEFSQQRGLDQARARRHVARRAVRVVFDLAPVRIFFGHPALHPDRHRGHSHLDEITGMVNRLGEWGRQHDQFAAVGRPCGV
jgi:hypothetical protein